ncbi:peptidase C13 family-domain-containing protein [Mycotypha africana]|uniref:peptidase C13 family-domain-containing protein n=1 Tax=Mycotypha africana TaxID=64632 RepID=UPI002301B9EF|nr:peptidase C13 family-domain-containing protein [Mycotypha africana]KAI8973390.1 peptidase C13 family-domain-containing protein [Mycotypha africana]
MRKWNCKILCLYLFSLFLFCVQCIQQQEQVEGFFSQSGHTNNWAVLVCTSRFWFNYRHVANTLSMYRTVKRLGIPDSNIILMLADDVSCNPRNKYPATVYNNANRLLDLYGDNVEVDYRGYEVTVENFIRLLTGRVSPSTPRSKRLLTDDRSNIFVYMTGHGGDEFLKFQDAEEMSAYDLADAFKQMQEKRRYNEIFFMIDTCQANTMYSQINSTNILATGSSRLDESSYSHHTDFELGVAVIDSFTYYNLEFLERIDQTSNRTLQELFDTYDPVKIASHPGIRSDLFNRPLDKVKVTDFFGNVQNVELTKNRYPLGNSNYNNSVQPRGEHIKENNIPTSKVNSMTTTSIKNGSSMHHHEPASFPVYMNKTNKENLNIHDIPLTSVISSILFTTFIGYIVKLTFH